MRPMTPAISCRLAVLLILAGTTTARGDEPALFTLATFNIHHAEGADGKLDLDRVAGVVREADIVAFQEVDVRFGARSRDEDQAARLGVILGRAVAFGPNLVRDGGRYGVAVVSKFPILSTRNIPLPRSPGREQAEPRGLLEVEVKLPDGGPLRVYATHLAHDSVEDRKRQVAAIRAVVGRPEAAGTPWVLLGDFNFRPESPEYARLTGREPSEPNPDPGPLVGMADSWAKVGRGPGATIRLDRPEHAHRIDYIFVSADLAPGLLDARVDTETRASDHQPVFVRLRRPATPAPRP